MYDMYMYYNARRVTAQPFFADDLSPYSQSVVDQKNLYSVYKRNIDCLIIREQLKFQALGDAKTHGEGKAMGFDITEGLEF